MSRVQHCTDGFDWHILVAFAEDAKVAATLEEQLSDTLAPLVGGLHTCRVLSARSSPILQSTHLQREQQGEESPEEIQFSVDRSGVLWRRCSGVGGLNSRFRREFGSASGPG